MSDILHIYITDIEDAEMIEADFAVALFLWEVGNE